MVILKILSGVLIVALFIYSKVNAHESKISIKYSKAYQLIKSILNPILNLLRKVFKPHQIGNGLFIDTSQIFLLVLLLIIFKS